MKKNKMMRTASGVMVATLLTTGVISGTFAKYVTEDSANDTARVAKWGVNLAVTGSLYGKEYSKKGNDAGNTIVQNGTEIASVKSSNNPQDNVIAPGTKNEEGLRIYLSGTPEVSSKLSAQITGKDIYLVGGNYGVMVKAQDITEENVAKCDIYKKSTNGNKTTYTKVTAYNQADVNEYYTLEDEVTFSKEYHPVTYKLGTNAEKTLEEVSLDLAKSWGDNSNITKAAVDANNCTFTYDVTTGDIDAGIDLGTKLATLQDVNITWEWKFTDAADESKISENDKKDTILGNLIADNAEVVELVGTDYEKVTVENNIAKANNKVVGSVATSFDITLTVTQVD